MNNKNTNDKKILINKSRSIKRYQLMPGSSSSGKEGIVRKGNLYIKT